MHLNVRLKIEKIPWRLVQNKAYRNETFPIFTLITNGGKVLDSPLLIIQYLCPLYSFYSVKYLQASQEGKSCYYVQTCYVYIPFKFCFS
jgi:hypothetical protein